MRHIGEKDKAGCNEVKRERRDFQGDKARTPPPWSVKRNPIDGFLEEEGR